MAVGLAVFALWLPLASQPPPTEDAAAQAGFAALSPAAKVLWAVTRVLGAVVVTPLVESSPSAAFCCGGLYTGSSGGQPGATARRPAALLISASGSGRYRLVLAGTLAHVAYGLLLLAGAA